MSEASSHRSESTRRPRGLDDVSGPACLTLTHDELEGGDCPRGSMCDCYWCPRCHYPHSCTISCVCPQCGEIDCMEDTHDG